ncbi:9042_t:CDS:2 [Ambispora leptoticha]|uniref:9042_t:CDS:1 n=1 Tax=Ambispora leptoticha TaxID=144679 RepID=A0A9N9N4Z3_9GLOM|nr:9042_t:CDS:2 [Ambispora leptoticha]
MRLITHNMLQCHVKGCNTNNFPLELSEIEYELQETEFNPQFLRNFVPKLEWDALVRTAMKLGITTLPDKLPDTPIQEIDEKFLKDLHRVLLETHIQQGRMTCPNCQHVYPIKDGIPNMLLNENEV